MRQRRIRQPRIARPWRSLLLLGVLLLSTTAAAAWEWSDFVSSSSSTGAWFLGSSSNNNNDTQTTPLSMQQVSDMRVRDIKRRLTRTHGYSAEEVAKMIDKKELIGALSLEEEKERLKQEDALKRALLQQGIVAAIVTILGIFCWPLLQHAWEVASVNLVVYTDRKKHEASRCWQLKSKLGMVGVLLMGILDVLQVWLTASILLSWVMKSKYFFPVPHIPLRPAQFMGGEIAQSSAANYGINVGSMLVTWAMRFTYGKIELWTGKALAKAHRQQRKQARAQESTEEKAERKAARRQAKLERQQQRQQAAAAAAAAANQRPGAQLPPDWMQPTGNNNTSNGRTGAEAIPPPPSSEAHEEFLNQLLDGDDQQPEEEYIKSELDELD